jgi:hypothetical protein
VRLLCFGLGASIKTPLVSLAADEGLVRVGIHLTVSVGIAFNIMVVTYTTMMLC